MSIERRALGGTVVGLAAFVANAVQTFLLVPVLLGAWGAERYGIWLALQAMTTLIATLDVGHQNYVGNELAKLYFGDRDALRTTLASAIWSAAAIGATEMLVVLGLGASGLIPRALGLSPAVTAREGLFAALVLSTATWVVVGSIGGVVARLLPPAGQFVRFATWGVVSRFAQTMAVAGSALAGLGILGTTAVNQVAILAYCAAFFWDLRKQFAWLWPMHRGPSASVGAGNVGRSLLLTGASTVAQLQQNGLNLIVTSTLGAAALPALSTARTVASTFLQASNILAAPLAPEMVRFHVNREYAKLIATLAANWLLGGALVQLGVLAALPILSPLYMLWTRHAFAFDRTLFALIAFAIVLRTLGAPLVTYLGSVNDLRALSAINVTQAGVVLAIASLGTRSLGLRAAGMAILGGEVVGSLGLPIAFVVMRLPSEWRRRMLRHAAVASAPALAAGAALMFYAHGTHPLRVIPLSLVVILPLAWAQWRELPLEVRDRIRRLLPRVARSDANGA